MLEDPDEFALRAANATISGRQRREANRFASIELRNAAREHQAWEAAALGTVALASLLLVVGLWFL